MMGMTSVGNSTMGLGNPMLNNMNMMSMNQMMQNQMKNNQMMMGNSMENIGNSKMNPKQREMYKQMERYMGYSYGKKSANKKEEEFKNIDLNKKDDIMKIINSQDFINGFWEINELTEIIKEKYKKDFDLLKGIKNNKIMINDKVAITILIIYFINEEHPELLDELLMIIAKAKIFISKEAKESYENIIKEIGIN